MSTAVIILLIITAVSATSGILYASSQKSNPVITNNGGQVSPTGQSVVQQQVQSTSNTNSQVSPTGQSVVQQQVQSTSNTNSQELTCDSGTYYDPINNKCVDCPSSSSRTGNGGPVAGHPTCICPANNIWDATTNSCVSCPPGQGYDGASCKTCIGDTIPDGVGEVSIINRGCRCPLTTQEIEYDSTCHTCQSGTSIHNQGGPVEVPMYCRCPSEQYWANGKCNPGCPPGTNSTNTGLTAWGVYGGLPNCKCPAGQAWGTDNNGCVTCATPSLCDTASPDYAASNPCCIM